MQAGLTGVDYVLIVVYLAGIITLGIWHGIRQRNTEEFLLAGRKMMWWPVAISSFAA